MNLDDNYEPENGVEGYDYMSIEVDKNLASSQKEESSSQKEEPHLKRKSLNGQKKCIYCKRYIASSKITII